MNYLFLTYAFRYPNVYIAIYTGDLDADPEKIISKAEKTFDIKLNRNIEFVYLHRRKWVEAPTYPHFTLLGQSLGSICLGLEALNNLIPGNIINYLNMYNFMVSIKQRHKSTSNTWLYKLADIYIDTMGYAFTYPLFKYIGGCRVGSYTHYPTISTDMLKYIYRRVIAHNNRRLIARNPFFSGMKILYYKFFARVSTAINSFNCFIGQKKKSFQTIISQ